jgi:cytochrome c-type biogenesis protein CcmF
VVEFNGVSLPVRYDAGDPGRRPFFFIGPTDVFATNPLLQNHILGCLPPADAVPRLRRVHRAVRVRDRALVTGRVGEGWLMETRRWTLFAWGFLTAASSSAPGGATRCSAGAATGRGTRSRTRRFLPWLTGTAYIHSVMVQERRGMLRVWNLSLVRHVRAHDPRHVPHPQRASSIGARVRDGSIGPTLLGFFA